MLPTVTIEGRLVADPDLRFGPSGVAVCKMRVVASKQKKNEETQKWEDDRTLWIGVTAFRQLAENCAESLGKGDTVTVVGQLETDEWTNEQGEKRSTIVVTAYSVAASLAFRTIKHGEGQAKRETPRAAAPAADPWSSSGGEPPF